MRTQQVPATDISKALEKGVDEADLVRASGLRGLWRIRAAKIIGLMREHVRLGAKLGRDHPRVVALAEKIGVERMLVQRLALEARRATTELPARDERAWLLHGLVHDEDLVPAPHLSIALYDQDGSWIAPLGYSATNRYGNFKLECLDLDRYAGQSLYVRVLDEVGTHLWIDKNPVVPKLGDEKYRDIVLREVDKVEVGSISNGAHPIADREHWVMRGRVTDRNVQGVGGMTVRVFDEERALSDRLGQARTDVDGYYLMTYRVAHFPDLVGGRPELFLEVLDEGGKVFYASRAPFFFEGGRAEICNVQISLALSP
jgi:hypothetical protein